MTTLWALFPDGVEAGRLDLAFENDVAGRLDVHLGRAVLECSARIGHGRRFVDRDFDLVDDVFRLFLALRHDGCNGFADKAHRTVRKHRLADRLVVKLVQHRSDLLYAGKIGRRDNHRTVWCRDTSQLSGGDGAAHETNPMSGGGVRGKAALARYQCGILEPSNGAADPGHA